MNGLDKMRLRMSADGGSLRQDKIHTSICYINDTFQDDPSYCSDGVQIIGENIIFPRIWNYKKEDNLSPTAEIQTKITEEFKRGQLLVLNGEHWLCLKSQCFHGMYWTGKLKQCTHLLYYQNVKTRAIESSWAVLERPYSKTLDNGQIITTSEMEFKAMLPFNDSTKKINLDRRLLTGTEYDKLGNEIGSVYEVTGRNGSSQVINGEGFLVLNMVQSVFNKETDRLDLMIADYVDPGAPPEPPEPPVGDLLKCEIIGRDNIKCGASAIRYNGIFYSSDNKTVIQDINMKWIVSLPSNFEKEFELRIFSDYITLRALDSEDIIGEKVEIKLVDNLSLYEEAIKIIEVIPL